MGMSEALTKGDALTIIVCLFVLACIAVWVITR